MALTTVLAGRRNGGFWAMPLFYFDTDIHGDVHRDCDGDEFDTPEAAVERAKLDAAQYVADQIRNEMSLDSEVRIVRNAGGDVIARFTVRDALIEVAKRT